VVTNAELMQDALKNAKRIMTRPSYNASFNFDMLNACAHFIGWLEGKTGTEVWPELKAHVEELRESEHRELEAGAGCESAPHTEHTGTV